MNAFSEQRIKDLNAIPLLQSKEWQRKHYKKLENKQVYWTWKQKVYTIKYICPMTFRVWFTKKFNGWSSDTNAITEMYLIPETKEI